MKEEIKDQHDKPTRELVNGKLSEEEEKILEMLEAEGYYLRPCPALFSDK